MSMERVSWDYTDLADAYLLRPQYADEFLSAALDRADLDATDRVADIGAGTGNLTVLLLRRGYQVDAVEPNAAMRRHGIVQTERFGASVTWRAATAEDTHLQRGRYGLVAFGSSFNVVEARAALKETSALLQPKGWFMCCWNHRDSSDPLQQAVDAVILKHLPHYEKGTRAEDQAGTIAASGLFEDAEVFSGRVVHSVVARDWGEAWKSHATLARQAGDRMDAIVADISALIRGAAMIDVPYITKGWLAQRRTR